jgi:hypothetical protein
VVSRLAAFGDDDRIPLALVVVNVLAVGAVGWLGAVLAIQLGRAPAWLEPSVQQHWTGLEVW